MPNFHQFANVQCELETESDWSILAVKRYDVGLSVLRQGTKHLNSVLNRVAKSNICVLNMGQGLITRAASPYPSIC